MRKPVMQSSGHIDPTNDVERWLFLHGFHFNPFAILDAAADPYLDRYLVLHEAFESIWGERSTLVFEPQGGGKTALRVRTVQACYIGQEPNRPFPISYLPPFVNWRTIEPTFEQHLKAILNSGGQQLLLSLAYRPHWFFALGQTERQKVRTVLEYSLPGPLNRYLDLINEGNRLDKLTKRISAAPLIRNQPELEAVLQWRRELLATASAPYLEDMSDRWEQFVAVVMEILQLPAIYLLIDGLDATDQTAHDPAALVRVCDPLWSKITEWTNKQIYMKAFLPQEAERVLQTDQPTVVKLARPVKITWTAELLKDMLLQRIATATQGAFSSFAAVSERDFIDVEQQLVHTAPLRPREVLVLTNQMLTNHVRQHGPSGRLRWQDWEQVVEEYQAQR